jgi:hypothetical protein
VEVVLSRLWFIGAGLVLHLELKHTPPMEQSRDNNRAARVLRSENGARGTLNDLEDAVKGERLGKGSSSGGGAIEHRTAAPHWPPRAYRLEGEGRMPTWKDDFTPDKLGKPQICHRISLLSVPPCTMKGTWAVH